ncbi:hypothetical protein ABZ456_29120 [Streptomyces sp. NPDC005776]|uniref:hypothetical protein n=1 Tax=Streptomyces sp. NPDC005776 TaxID=3154676 RepID=UPI0033CF361F
MGVRTWLSTGTGAAPPEVAPPRAVMAAAMPLAGPGVQAVARARRKDTQDDWQREAWYYYDAIGELRSPVTWIANAVSAATLYAAEVDPATGLITGPTDNEAVQRAAVAALGGTSHRAQLQQTLAVCWQVPGEAFIIVRARKPLRGVAQPDQWLVLSGTQVQPKGGTWQYTDPETLEVVQLGRGDRLLRVWSPHPNDQSRADTAVRPALPILREVEKASMNIAARLESRLASNGIQLVPQELDFPHGDDQNKMEAMASFLLEAMDTAIQNPGTAAAHSPILIEVPQEQIEAFATGRIDMATAMDAAVTELRQDALSRLAATLDMPKEVAEGTTGEANHWSAWQVEESTYKIYIEPLLARLGDAVTEYWFRPTLAAMGITDPERYCLAWDTSSIVARPDRLDDLLKLHEIGIVSDDAIAAEAGIPDDSRPTEEQLQLQRLDSIVRAAPTLAADPEIARRLFGFEIAPAAAGVSQAEVKGAPELEPGGDTGGREIPSQQQTDADEVSDGLTAAAELLVFDALSRAGGRLLTRGNRGQFASTPKHELHTVIAAADVGPLLEGSFQFVDGVADAYGVDRANLTTVLRAYVTDRLTVGHPHDRKALRFMLGHLPAGHV